MKSGVRLRAVRWGWGWKEGYDFKEGVRGGRIKGGVLESRG